jgi:hypothetical protein
MANVFIGATLRRGTAMARMVGVRPTIAWRSNIRMPAVV